MARCVALLGMMATHVLEPRTPTGELSFSQALAGGRASALFAVLAGVSIALVTGRATPVRGSARARASVALVVRAAIVAILGLILADLDSGIAIILAYYGLLFVLVLPFIALSARWLVVTAAVWVVAAPVLSQWLRPSLPERGFSSPSFTQLGADPLGLLSELAFTGYYPAVPWLAYALVGLAVGRLDLASRRTPIRLAALGAALSLGATAVSQTLTARADVARALVTDPPSSDASAAALLDRISQGLPGTTPTGGAWEWLLVVAPHTATPFDLVQTIGSSLFVIGVSLFVVATFSEFETRAVAILFGAGTMTLTLYSLHVLGRSPFILPDTLRDSYVFHVLVVMGIGAVFVAARLRGPLEWVVGETSRLHSRP